MAGLAGDGYAAPRWALVVRYAGLTPACAMDNLTHSLVGIALSRAFFKKRMALATTTLVIAANAPDLDLLWSGRGIRYLQYHRGIAHSLFALPVWALLIAGGVYFYARRR